MKLAQDEGSPVRGFGVVEYESAEQAEAVLIDMDRTLVGGQEVRLSLCTPGTSGRSTLAALIAAQGMVSSRHRQENRQQLVNIQCSLIHSPGDLQRILQLPTSDSVEALVTFKNPYNHPGVSQTFSAGEVVVQVIVCLQ